KFTASVQLIHNEGPNAFRTSEFGEAFRPQPLSEPAFRNLLHSQELLHRVGAKCSPPLSPRLLSQRMRLSPDRNVEFITVTVLANSGPNAISLANLFAEEATSLTKEMQVTEANGIITYLRERLRENEGEQEAAKQQLASVSRSLPKAAVSDAEIRLELKEARKKLLSLNARYTPLYPEVQQQRAVVEALEQQLIDAGAPATASTNAAGSVINTKKGDAPGSKADELDALLKRAEGRIEAIEKSRSVLQGRLREAQ